MVYAILKKELKSQVHALAVEVSCLLRFAHHCGLDLESYRLNMGSLWSWPQLLLL